ncbi:hypothetical protein [Qipengyuania sp.]|uniref:hypothetical protein n=1 Tax=Qipengyuania sp. TaxID=2004515 RepID=UPI003AF9D2A6
MSHIDDADRLARKRSTMLPVIAIIFVQQFLVFNTADGTVAIVLQVAWVVMSLLATLTLLTGGMWLHTRALRSLINDELSESNRQKGVAAAFVSAMLVAVLIFAVAPFEPIPTQRAAHLVVTVSLAVGLLVFALAERKSLG